MFAGAAKVDITPTRHLWMDGMIRAHPSVGVHDPLFARALVMSEEEDPGKACAVVSVDVCGLSEGDASGVRAAVEARVGIPARRVVLAATHTHSGPATVGFFNPPETQYVRELSDKLVGVIQEAAGELRAAEVGWGWGEEKTISHYRRLLADDGHVVMNWEAFPAERIVGPLGEVDPEVAVLRIVDRAGQPVCLLFNHAGHPNVLSGDNYLLSADYPGLAARLLEEELGGIAMFLNGAQGTMDIDGLRDRDWEGMERVGRALAAAVAGTAGTIKPSPDAALRSGHLWYELPPRKISEEELCWADEVLKESGGRIRPMADGVGDDHKALLFKELAGVQDRPIPVEQICIAVGEAALISFPGELFTEIGMRIKAESPFRGTSIIGLANGYVGYVPTRQAVTEGGYAVETRRVALQAGAIVADRSLALLVDVFESQQ